jgi:hypothetical protein
VKMASLLHNWEHVAAAPVDLGLPQAFSCSVNDVKGRLAAAAPDKAWQVALDVVDEQVSPANGGCSESCLTRGVQHQATAVN